MIFAIEFVIMTILRGLHFSVLGEALADSITLVILLIPAIHFFIYRPLKKSLDEQMDASKYKTRIIADVGHELRTPLNSIMGITEILKDESQPEEREHYLDLLQSIAEHMTSMIGDYLDFSRIEINQLTLAHEEFNLKAFIQQTFKMLEITKRQAGIDLFLQVDPSIDDDLFLGDPTRLRQVLVNLLTNAIKFTEVGFVRLSVKVIDSGFVTFLIEDSGKGIKTDDLKQIFDPYKKFSTVKNTLGAGLGLAISSKIVDAMGGNITVKSEKGVGTLFHVNVPLKRVGKAPKVKKNVGVKVDKNVKILLIDDDEATHVILKFYLKDETVTLFSCFSGEEGLIEFKKNDYDLVFVDLNMPIQDGLKTVIKMRNWEKASEKKEIPIIALTAETDSLKLTNSLQNGFTDYYHKPVKKDQFISLVNQMSK